MLGVSWAAVHRFGSHCVSSLWFLLRAFHFLSAPTENYCFASRASSCSECLQAGVGCAYCSEEVRVKKLQKYERAERRFILNVLILSILNFRWHCCLMWSSEVYLLGCSQQLIHKQWHFNDRKIPVFQLYTKEVSGFFFSWSKFTEQRIFSVN